MRYLLIISLFFSCAKIHFKNGSDTKAQIQKFGPHSNNSWHHVGVMSFVELEGPFNLEGHCEEWSQITTSKDIPQAVFGFLPYVSFWYSPWTLTLNCKK